MGASSKATQILVQRVVISNVGERRFSLTRENSVMAFISRQYSQLSIQGMSATFPYCYLVLFHCIHTFYMHNHCQRRLKAIMLWMYALLPEHRATLTSEAAIYRLAWLKMLFWTWRKDNATLRPWWLERIWSSLCGNVEDISYFISWWAPQPPFEKVNFISMSLESCVWSN